MKERIRKSYVKISIQNAGKSHGVQIPWERNLQAVKHRRD